MTGNNKRVFNDRPEIPVIEDLKEILKNYNYHHVPLGRVYKHQFIVDYWAGLYTKNVVSKKNVILVRIYLLLKLFFVTFKKKTASSSLENSILIETLSVENRVKGLWKPLIQNKKELKITLLSSIGIEKHIDINQPFIKTNLLRGNTLNIIIWYFKNYKALIKEIRKICSRYNLSNNSSEIIFNSILSTVILIEQYYCLFQKKKPLSFVAIDDQQVHGAIICNLLNSYQIPTYTHVHGAVGVLSMDDFVPLNAKYVLCWGEYMRRLFVNEGIEPERTLVVGCQRSNKKTEISKAKILELKHKIGIEKENLSKPVILFGFTRLITDNWVSDLKYLGKKLSDSYQLICRLHPSTSYKDLSKYQLGSTRELIISESTEIELTDHIALSDIVIIDSSTLGFDALILGKTVIVLDSAHELKTQDVMFDVINTNAALFCKSASEVIDFLNDGLNRTELKFSSEKFLKNYITFYGTEAANEILIHVKKN